jgi:hypothetical protein
MVIIASVFTAVDSYAAGCNLWHSQFPRRLLLGGLSPSGVTSPTGAEKGSDAGVGEFFNRLT